MTTPNKLREAVDDVMNYHFSQSREGMAALQVLIDTAFEAAGQLERLKDKDTQWYAEDEIADACVYAEIPDSKYESLMLSLRSWR